jgi:hypothetical protein
MALEIEDGTGKTDADSYVSVADLVAYAEARGKTIADSPADNAEAALRKATQWIDATYRARFSGTKTNGREQALQWPRTDAVDADGEEIAEDEVPAEIIQATCEAAIREYEDPDTLAPDLDRGGAIQSIKAGSVAITYADGAPGVTTFQMIDGILAGLLLPDPAKSPVFVMRA